MDLNFSTCHCPLTFDLHMFACVGLHPPHSYICTQDVDNRHVENGPYFCIEHLAFVFQNAYVRKHFVALSEVFHELSAIEVTICF